MSELDKKYRLYLIRAIYLGSEPMGELLDGENGSDAVQVPLKRTILRTDGEGDEVDLIATEDALCVNFVKAGASASEHDRTLMLPIESLAYCGALKQLSPDIRNDREFETLDKIPNDSKLDDPPLFVAIFRSFDNENTLLCHSFVIRKDIEAMELVQNVMETYYNVVGQLENAETHSSHGGNESKSVYHYSQHSATAAGAVTNGHSAEHNAVYTTSDGTTLTQTELDRLLHAYHNTSTYEQHNQINTQSILSNRGSSQFVAAGNVSAKDILNQSLDPAQYDVVRGESFTHISDGNLNAIHKDEYAGVELNQDEDPIVIKKKNDEPLVYKQNVYIRWLQPPTPPPPAPIIIREVPAPQPEPLPPLVVYKQQPREKTPPPLIIREKPPSPVQQVEPLVIERRLPAIEPPPRRVIVEELPAPPPKPRDIILEKWLPREAPKRPVVVERVPIRQHHHHHHHHQSQQQQPVITTYHDLRSKRSNYYNSNRVYAPNYDYVDPSRQYYYNNNQNYEVVERSRVPAKRIIRHVIRPVRQNGVYGGGAVDQQYVSESYRQQQISPIPMHQQQQQTYPQYPVYSTHQYVNRQHRPQPQVTGYRVIRQIIPGPNATQDDIERALARSQHIGAYTRQGGVYSPPQTNNPYDAYNETYSHRGYSQSPPRGSRANPATRHVSSSRKQNQQYVDPNLYRSSSVD